MRHGKYDHENLSEDIQPRMSDGNDWRLQSACLESDPDIFFPEDADNEADRVQREMAARKTCASCDVRMMCLDFALRNGDESGIFAGLDAEERRLLIAEKQGEKSTGVREVRSA